MFFYTYNYSYPSCSFLSFYLNLYNFASVSNTNL